MVTWADVTQWQSAPLQGAVGPLNGEYNKLIACSDDLRAINTPDGWFGDAATAAANAVTRIIDGLEEYSAELAAARRAVADTGDAITGIQHGVAEAEGLAAAHHFAIADNGAIIDKGPPPDVPDDQQEAVAAERRAVAAELRDRVDQVLRSAVDLDNDFCAVLDKILSGQIIDAAANDNQTTELAAAGNAGLVHGSLSIPPPPTDGATAAQNAAYWATLSEGQRTQLAMDRPGLVGNRDGFAAKQRDIANRILLGREQARLMGELKTAKQNGDLGKVEELAPKVEALKGLTNRLESTADAPETEKYYLLSIDGNDDGRVILAKGNPDTAANVATFVPGTGIRLETAEGSFERGDAMHAAARRAGSPSTSVITWADYDAPNHIGESIVQDYAHDAKTSFDSFQDGLRESHQGPPSHNTAVGHSYGSTVVGLTARDEGLNADDIVNIASPGMGAHNASQLDFPGDHIWSTAAENDFVPDTQWHGNDPTDADFGGRTFESSPGTSGSLGYSREAHSQYWDSDNPALRHTGQIIAGKPPE